LPRTALTFLPLLGSFFRCCGLVTGKRSDVSALAGFETENFELFTAFLG
jgi:hypothetical protein